MIEAGYWGLGWTRSAEDHLVAGRWLGTFVHMPPLAWWCSGRIDLGRVDLGYQSAGSVAVEAQKRLNIRVCAMDVPEAYGCSEMARERESRRLLRRPNKKSGLRNVA